MRHGGEFVYQLKLAALEGPALDKDTVASIMEL